MGRACTGSSFSISVRLATTTALVQGKCARPRPTPPSWPRAATRARVRTNPSTLPSGGGALVPWESVTDVSTSTNSGGDGASPAARSATTPSALDPAAVTCAASSTWLPAAAMLLHIVRSGPFTSRCGRRCSVTGSASCRSALANCTVDSEAPTLTPGRGDAGPAHVPSRGGSWGGGAVWGGGSKPIPTMLVPTMGGHVDTTTFVGAALRNVQGLTQVDTEPTLQKNCWPACSNVLKESWLLLLYDRTGPVGSAWIQFGWLEKSNSRGFLRLRHQAVGLVRATQLDALVPADCSSLAAAARLARPTAGKWPRCPGEAAPAPLAPPSHRSDMAPPATSAARRCALEVGAGVAVEPTQPQPQPRKERSICACRRFTARIAW